MIEIKDKSQCCGCTVCYGICPINCIKMINDEEGFCYPKVDESKCINCHFCEIKCPVLNKKIIEYDIELLQTKEEITKHIVDNSEVLPKSYVCFLKDCKIREESTSGGIFTAIAKYVLKQNGVIYGVLIDDRYKIKHDYAYSEDELKRFRGSKYVQSEQIDIYSKVKTDLENDLWVLYTGTPCQVAGLKSYLAKEYNKLITMDVFCHGVGSPAYWDKYVKYMTKKYNSKIEKIRFREKTYGYNSACMALYFENGRISKKGHDDDLFWTAFSKCYIFRPSCYKCSFKTLYHDYSDFSIGDYWDVQEMNKTFQDAEGCSLLLVHSEKGNKILKNCESDIIIQEVDITKSLIINGGHQVSKLISSSDIPGKQKEFMRDMHILPIEDLVDKYIYLSFIKRLKCIVKPWLFKLGILNKVKRIKVGKRH